MRRGRRGGLDGGKEATGPETGAFGRVGTEAGAAVDALAHHAEARGEGTDEGELEHSLKLSLQPEPLLTADKEPVIG